MQSEPRRTGTAVTIVACVLSGMSLAASTAYAVDVPIAGNKLVVTDRLASTGRATVRFLTRDAQVALPPGVIPEDLSVRAEVYLADTPSNAAAYDLLTPWIAGRVGQAKYKNPVAPSGGGVRSAHVRTRLAKLVAVSLGDDQTIALTPSTSPVDVRVVLTLRDEVTGTTTRWCTRFSASVKAIAGGTGARLRATGGTAVACPGTIAMDAAHSSGFLSFPWPNDVRRMADGTLDLTGWPGRATNALVDLIMARGSAITHGFGTNAAVYLQTTVPLAPSSLPTADGSVAASSALVLARLDAPGDVRAPIRVDFRSAPTALRPDRLLTLLPYPGHPLPPATRWAAIAFDDLTDTTGQRLRPAPLLHELDAPWDASKPVDAATWAALRTQRDDVRTWVTTHTTHGANEILGFTVFTTQEIAPELDAIAAAVAALPAPAPVSRGAGSCPVGTVQSTVSGQVDLPVWQTGVRPFDNSGGAIVVTSGVAVQQGTERVTFRMTYPCGPAPADGWPILLFMDGTGGSARSSSIPYFGSASLPYVVASIAPMYSGDRTLPGLPAELQFFNYLNPMAGRTNQLQQAADMLFLRRVADGITLSAAETGTGTPVPTNGARVVIAGHSQGALTVPHALAVDPAFTAGFLSAGGGGFYHSLAHRGDVRSLVESLAGALPGELDDFHPAFHALQTFAEIGDAANYASRVTSAHVVSVGGLIDGCSPLEVISHLSTALGTPVANPLYVPVFGSAGLETSTVALPVGGNMPGARTAVTIQLDTGHFGTVTNPAIGVSFLTSLAAGGVPTVDPGVLASDATPGCSGRAAPLP